MFDINWSELVVIGVVALIVIGPKELPAVLRAIGQWTTKIRRMAGEFQSQFQEAMREAEMADLKKQVDDLGDAAKGFASDPLDFKEATKWEPKAPEPASGADATADAAPAAAASETPGTAAEPASASAPESSSGESPALPAPSVGSSSEPHSTAPHPAEPHPAEPHATEPHATEPMAEGSGRA
jgi:sec-independent protein translocase protein TatB